MLDGQAKWYERIPHPVTMLFAFIAFATILSYILPAGLYEREFIDGRQRVIPQTFQIVDQSPVSLLDMFVAMGKGFSSASEIIWVVLASGIMFGVLQETKMVENAVGTIVKKLGLQRKYILVFIMTFVF